MTTLRVGVAARWGRVVGGVEAHLELALTGLAARGHAVALLVEGDGPVDRRPLRLSPAVHVLRGASALAAFAAWGPQVLYVHGVEDLALERSLLELGRPSAAFVHDYARTCVSGVKAFAWPTPRPCGRPLGPVCLGLYPVRRCGGRSPATMLVSFMGARARLALLRRYARVLTHSGHMAEELARCGVLPARVRVVPFGVLEDATVAGGPPALVARPAGGTATVVAAGRMVRHKGFSTLVEAIACLAPDRRPALVLVGDGPERARLELLARARGVRSTFTGWLDGGALEGVLRGADLLALPSLWPEPFGMVGPEAGRWGVPAVAFDVGGVAEWLVDGRSGRLAPGDPPTAAGLGAAIAWCLADSARLAKLRQGARAEAARFTLGRHLDALEAELGQLAGGRRDAPS